jgi:hypothetical protein
MSGRFRKGATVAEDYCPGDYDYLCNSKLSLHAARPHTPLPLKRQVVPHKKVVEPALRRPEGFFRASASTPDCRKSAASRPSD